MAKRLPLTHDVEGQMPGNCMVARAAVSDAKKAQMARLRDHMVQVANLDRSALMADIDAAHALALN